MANQVDQNQTLCRFAQAGRQRCRLAGRSGKQNRPSSIQHGLDRRKHMPCFALNIFGSAQQRQLFRCFRQDMANHAVGLHCCPGDSATGCQNTCGQFTENSAGGTILTDLLINAVSCAGFLQRDSIRPMVCWADSPAYAAVEASFTVCSRAHESLMIRLHLNAVFRALHSAKSAAGAVFRSFRWSKHAFHPFFAGILLRIGRRIRPSGFRTKSFSYAFIPRNHMEAQ